MRSSLKGWYSIYLYVTWFRKCFIDNILIYIFCGLESGMNTIYLYILWVRKFLRTLFIVLESGMKTIFLYYVVWKTIYLYI